MGRLLELLGACVLVTNTGESAVREYAVFNPELLLIDIVLPDINGYEVARMILSKHNNRHPYMVAVSGLAQAEDINRSIAAGFDEHIVKPASMNTIKKVLLNVSNQEVGQ